MRLIDAIALYASLQKVIYSLRRDNTLNGEFAANVIETVQDEYLAQAPTIEAYIPPCKPWDKAWIIDKTLDTVNGGMRKIVCEGEITKLSYNGFTNPMEWLDYRWDSPLVGQTTRHDRIDLCLGKTVFITREEAEKALTDYPIANGMTMQNDELLTNCKQLWIPASEPPTEYRDEYGELIPFLVCEAGTEYPFRAMYDGNTWGDGLCTIPVTHWMPLPDPPKGERLCRF